MPKKILVLFGIQMRLELFHLFSKGRIPLLIFNRHGFERRIPFSIQLSKFKCKVPLPLPYELRHVGLPTPEIPESMVRAKHQPHGVSIFDQNLTRMILKFVCVCFLMCFLMFYCVFNSEENEVGNEEDYKWLKCKFSNYWCKWAKPQKGKVIFYFFNIIQSYKQSNQLQGKQKQSKTFTDAHLPWLMRADRTISGRFQATMKQNLITGLFFTNSLDIFNDLQIFPAEWLPWVFNFFKYLFGSSFNNNLSKASSMIISTALLKAKDFSTSTEFARHFEAESILHPPLWFLTTLAKQDLNFFDK